MRDLEVENKNLKATMDKSPVRRKAGAPGGAAGIARQPSSGAAPSLGKTNVRVLSLKQLKDMIADMYQSKVKFDKKCEESKVARETMEQFMYTYLNQKYGLKPLIVEWAAAIINGVKRYIRADHDVTLFAKILKNECDEEFRFI